ncbi:hypothetical protein [Moorena producens]|nr:hypothetical protein [Moorena producens]
MQSLMGETPKTALHRCSLKTINLYLTSRRIAIRVLYRQKCNQK